MTGPEQWLRRDVGARRCEALTCSVGSHMERA